VLQLATELADYYDQPAYLKATTMGLIVKQQLKQELKSSLKHIPKTYSKIGD
jgi:hypothetical protein